MLGTSIKQKAGLLLEIGFFSGGAGSRTRVRDGKPPSIYMLILVLESYPMICRQAGVIRPGRKSFTRAGRPPDHVSLSKGVAPVAPNRREAKGTV